MLRDEMGTALITVLFFVVMISVLAMGASALVPLEGRLATRMLESEQALFIAEGGLQYAKAYLEGKFPDFPGTCTETKALGNGIFSITLTPLPVTMGWMREFEVVSVGTVKNSTRILRTVERIGAFSKYVYFTDEERPPSMNSPIWFATSDTLTGPVHTNDQIHIMGDPSFLDEVASAWGGPDDSDPSHFPSFMYYNGSGYNHVETAAPSNPPYDNPTFMAGYDLGAGRIELPVSIVDLQVLAQDAGLYTNQTTQIEFSREIGGTPLHGYVSYRTRQGQSWTGWTDIEIASLTAPVFYVDGLVYLSGTLDGQMTIATSGNMEIVNDVVYRDATNGIPNEGCDDMLGLISSGDVIIADNAANGDGIVIDASIMAIGGSFRVEDYNQGSPRGTLRVCGGIIQRYRGAVGTGSIGQDGRVYISTGYQKDYVYDVRFRVSSPPYFLSTGQYVTMTWSEITSG
jgi:hypothetical protein